MKRECQAYKQKYQVVSGRNLNRIQELDVYLKLESIFINKILETY